LALSSPFSLLKLNLFIINLFKKALFVSRFNRSVLMKDLGYQYEPLGDGEFRLLRLHPGRGSSDLESNLIICSLKQEAEDATGSADRSMENSDQDGGLPASGPQPYEALSYTWGPPGKSEVFIKILSHSEAYRIVIRPSLESALRQLRSTEHYKFFWVDALCINQPDTDEKSSQIPKMWEVYNGAFNVCVWLGAHADGSERAMDFVNEIVKLDNLEQLVQDTHNSEKWAALSSLMRRPWFSRRWIVQEIALAKTATLHCGESLVSWRDFADAISLFNSKSSEIRQLFRKSTVFNNPLDYLGDITELGATRLVHACDNIFRKSDDGAIMEHMLSLEALMSSLSAFEATDPHDTVYAVLWLAHDARPISKKEDTLFGIRRNMHNPGPSSPISEPTELSPQSATRVIAEDQPEQPFDSMKRRSSESYEGQRATRRRVNSVNSQGVPSVHVVNENERVIPYTANSLRDQGLRSTVLTNGEDLNARRTDSLWDAQISRPIVTTTNVDRPPNTRLDVPKPQTLKAGSRTHIVLERVLESIRAKRITVDYKKSVFEVCRDFLAFTINRSHSLNMICPPWAPDDPMLPSWIPRLSGKAFGLSTNKTYRRVNADPLVRSPGWDRGHYNAAPNTKVLPIPRKSSDSNRILRVNGFAFDKIGAKYTPATAGIIPAKWLGAGGWEDTNSYPREYFWRTLVGNRDAHGQKPPSHWIRACKDAFNRRPTGGALNTGEVLTSNCPSPTVDFLERVQCMVWERRLVSLCGPPCSSGTDQQICTLGLAPSKCKKRDLVCILFGCSVPVLLRKFIDGRPTNKGLGCTCNQVDCQCDPDIKRSEDGTPTNVHYEFIGECYVHGMMDGEAFRVQKANRLKYQMFDLQ